ncbi:hypothetical protein [Azospirillum sp. sgz301742]
MDFRANTHFFDADRDGLANEMGRLPHPDIDPVDFYTRHLDSATYCYDDGHAS